MIDPSIDIKSKSRIIAGLEKQIIEKEIEYSNLVKYMNRNSVEVKSLKSQIESLKQKLNSIKDNLSGSSKRELNRNLFEFERLKSDMEFNRERYKQTLIQLDLALIEATQNAKNSITVVEPTLPDSYDKPDKLKSIFTLFILLFLKLWNNLYGFMLLIRDPRGLIKGGLFETQYTIVLLRIGSIWELKSILDRQRIILSEVERLPIIWREAIQGSFKNGVSKGSQKYTPLEIFLERIFWGEYYKSSVKVIGGALLN